MDSDNLTPEDIHEIIQLAWDDKASFNSIEAQTGLKEKQVKRIMRDNMKPSSFRMWRKRVYGRDMKHAAFSPLERDNEINSKRDKTKKIRPQDIDAFIEPDTFI